MFAKKEANGEWYVHRQTTRGRQPGRPINKKEIRVISRGWWTPKYVDNGKYQKFCVFLGNTLINCPTNWSNKKIKLKIEFIKYPQKRKK